MVPAVLGRDMVASSRFAVLAVALAFVPSTAHAADERLRLRWTAPPECPSEADVHAAALRGVDPAASGGVLEADAVVVATKAGSAWRLELVTRRGGRTGERAIEASTCQGVADAAAVLLAIALGPSEAGSAEVEPRAPEAPPPATPAADADRSELRRRAAVGRPRALALGIAGALDTATLPVVAVGGALSVGWTPGRARVELETRVLASQSATLEASQAGADFSVLTFGARGCFAVVHGGSLEVSPCAGADVHFGSAAGYGARTNFDASARWTALTGGVLLRAPLASWLAVRARADLAVPLARPDFVVQNEGSVHRPAAAAALVTAGLEANFL